MSSERWRCKADYDQRCADVAEVFIDHSQIRLNDAARTAAIEELAQAIQDTIEDWLTPRERAEKAEAERDAALAEVERLKAENGERMSRARKPQRLDTLECPRCGCVAAFDEVSDGDVLLCGCEGHVSCDAESEPYVVIEDCHCDSAEGKRP